MATIKDKSESKSPCENEFETFNPEFATELSNKLEHLSPRNEGLSSIDMFDDRLHEMTASYSEISFDSPNSPQDLGSDLGISPDSPDFMGKRLEGRPSIFEDLSTENDSKRPHSLDLQKYETSDDKSSTNPFHQAFDDLHREGTVTKEGDMVLFVAEDLEAKIKLSSPITKKGDTPSFPGSRTSTPCLYRQALMPQLPVIDPNVLNDLEAEVKKVATSVDTLTENLAGILHSVSALTVDCLEIYRDAVCKTCDAVDSNIKAMYQLMAKCEELRTTLSAETKSVVWDPEDNLKTNSDFSRGHSLTIKQATLGDEAKTGEVNVVQAETVGYNTDVKVPLFRLEVGVAPQCMLDLSFPDAPVTLTLIKGSGPIHITGYHSIVSMMDEQSDEELDEEEGDLEDDLEDDEEALANGGKADPKKRRLSNLDKQKNKRAKLDDTAEDEDDESPRKGKIPTPKQKKAATTKVGSEKKKS
uniref:Uncharacterized protein n=1 Tax=Timema douglasi TaxID=61478 RepID=A0A7R8VA89_TIMDO|nr:unnamed protein product [Timema douglasi]